MDKLTYQLKELRNENREGSFATQKARQETHNLIASQLKKEGFNQMNVDALKEKHVVALVDRWKNEGISPGTMKNRMSHIRWTINKVNLSRQIPTNKELGIDNRKYVTNENKAVKLEQKHIDKISDPNIKDSVTCQALFGTRREESMKLNPTQADKGDHLKMSGSWCKNGRSRDIPITTPQQRAFINELKNRYGNNSLIPAHKSYKQQKDTYKNSIPKSGLGKGHGLRHNYAQQRYKEITGKECPVNGGKRQRDMTKDERVIDKKARLQITEELGHGREQITSVYLGS